ncbi:hypothetical protein ACNPK7_17015, partial [Shewanella marisflavi]
MKIASSIRSILSKVSSNLLMLSAILTLSACSGDDDGFPTPEIFTPPNAKNLTIEPEAAVDSQLTAQYFYSDNAQRPEGDSLIEWLINDEIFATSVNFTPNKSLENKWVRFCVTPKASYGNNDTGARVCSPSAIILPKDGSAPIAEEVLIQQPLQPGRSTSASYSYSDADGDLEGAS